MEARGNRTDYIKTYTIYIQTVDEKRERTYNRLSDAARKKLQNSSNSSAESSLGYI